MPKTFLFITLILSIMAGCASQKTNLKTVPFVDLDKYQGQWYEIASYPNRFQKGCHCTTATYTKSEKGYIVVENRCLKGGIDGKESSIKGKAFVQKDSSNAKLKVQFFWPFRAHYWIIDLAPDYSHAVVSHPNMKYLWILSRTPEIDETLFNQIIDRLVEMGFEREMIRKTVQFG